jgi:hypothetical protein
MAQNVGIASFGRSACIPLIISNLDDLYRIACRKPLRLYRFIPISGYSQFTNHQSLTRLDYRWHPVCLYMFCDSTRLIEATHDRLEITSSWSFGEVLLTLLRAASNSTSRTALVCGGALHCSLGCQRPAPCYRGAVFIGDDLAVQSSPCSSAPDGQGDMVAFVRRRR